MTISDDAPQDPTRCRAAGCPRRIAGNRYFCRKHWAKLSGELRARLIDLFRPEFLDFSWKNPPSQEFVAALRACRESLPEEPVLPMREGHT